MGIKGYQHILEKKIFDIIADENNNLIPKKEKKAEEVKITKHHVNWKRYFNVLFSDTICPKLALRGELLSKEQMTKGLKTDELFLKEIIIEYNNKEKHNALQHDVANYKVNLSVFPPINWKEPEETLSTVIREYEQCFNNWKLSGNHGGFVEIWNQNPFLILLAPTHYCICMNLFISFLKSCQK